MHIENQLFLFVYGCAMADAVNQKAYPHEDKLVEQYPAAMLAVKKLVDEVLTDGFATQAKYDAAFLQTAQKVGESIPAFTFGNIQKLINMVFKHMYILGYQNVSMRRKFRFCHCPLDGQMQSAVWDVCKENAIELGKKTDFQYAWSKEDFPNLDRYWQFQNAVRALVEATPAYGYSPLEADYFLW